MATIVMFDRFWPTGRGIAADFSDRSLDPDPMAAAQLADRRGSFEWFERSGALAAASRPAAVYEDCWGTLGMLEEAQSIGGLFRLLVNSFSPVAQPVDDDGGLMEDFNYGAVAAGEESQAAAVIDSAAQIAVDWRDGGMLRWTTECDICPGYTMRACDSGLGIQASVESAVGDLSDLVEDVRCEATDVAGEINQSNQGLGDSFADDDLTAFARLANNLAVWQSLADLTWRTMIALNEWANEQWINYECQLVQAAADCEAAERRQAEYAAAEMAEAEVTDTEIAELIDTETELANAYDCEEGYWDIDDHMTMGVADGRGCPFLTGEESITQDDQAAREMGGPVSPGQELATNSASAPWGGCTPKTERSDFAWYYKQGELDKSPCESDADAASEDPAEPQAAARLAHTLTDALLRAAEALGVLSAHMEKVGQEAMREAARRENQSARVPKEHTHRRDVKTADIIYVEI